MKKKSYAVVFSIALSSAIVLASASGAQRVGRLDGPSAQFLSPSIVVSPDSLVDSVFVSVVKTRWLTIHNTGDSNLDWQIDVATTFDGSLDSVHILWDRSHGQAPASSYPVMMSELTARGATITENFSTLSPALLDGIDVLWTVDFTSTWSMTEMEAVRDWVWAGGGLLLEVDSSVSVPTVNTLLNLVNAGLYYKTWAVGTGYATNVTSHPATAGVDTVYVIGADAYISSMYFPSGSLVGFGGLPVAAQGTFRTGLGAVIGLTDEMFYDPGPGGPSADNILFGNRAIDWLATLARWVTPQTTSGVVAPGDSAVVEITLDPRKLYEGTFEAELRVRSNDPVAPAVIVPVHLRVTGAPEIALSATHLDFGTMILPDEVRTKSFEVSNVGTAPLVVSGIMSSDPRFTPTPTEFTLARGSSRAVDVVFVSPTEGTFEATLSIFNTDPNRNPAVVTMAAAVADSARIVVSPDSLDETTWAGGTVNTELWIKNIGGRPLFWRGVALGLYGTSILYDRSKGQGSRSVYGELLNDLTGSGATVVESNSTITSTLLAGYDIYWTTEMQSNWSSSEKTALKDWTLAGGRLLLEGDEGYSRSNFNSLLPTLNAGITYSTLPGASGVTTQIVPHEITSGVNSIWLPGPQSSLSVSPPVGTLLVAASNGRSMIAVSSPGSGRLVTLADEVFANPYLLQEDNELCANQMFKWLAGSLAWVSLSPDTGSVAPDDSVAVQVTMSTLGLTGGDYSATLLFKSNAPFNPTVYVPVRLHVLDAPNIELSTNALDFGVVAVNSTSTKQLVVRNTGQALLSVTDITSSNPEFTANPTSFIVSPGGSQAVDVQFVPLSLGLKTGTLAITSDDPFENVVEVSLVGSAMEIEVSPASFTESLYSQGTTQRTLTIRNLGPGPFDWRFDTRSGLFGVSPGGGDHRSHDGPEDEITANARAGTDELFPAGAVHPSLSGVRILFDRSHGQETTSNWSVLIADLVARGAQFAENTGPITSSLLSGSDIFWTIDMVTSWPSAEVTALKSWVQGGGNLFLIGDDATSVSNYNGLLSQLGAGIVYATSGSMAGVTTSILLHETTVGVDSLTLAAPSARLSGVTSPAVPLFQASNGVYMGAARVIISGMVFGRVVALAEELFASSAIQATDNRRFGNQLVSWLAHNALWLSAQPGEGTIAENDSAQVAIRFDSADLCAGTFDARVRVVSATGNNTVKEVPASMFVSPAPNVVISDTSITFDSVFVGNTDSRSFTILNDGCADLIVTGLTMSSPSFSVDSTGFGLWPKEKRSITVLFRPVSAGLNTGMLSIESDDPDDGVVWIRLAGEGIAPPDIAVSPDSLSQALLPEEAAYRALQVANPGSAALTYQIDMLSLTAPALSASAGAVATERPDGEKVGRADAVRVSRSGSKPDDQPVGLHAPAQPYETGGPPAARPVDPGTPGVLQSLPFEGGPLFTENFEDGNLDGWVDGSGGGVKEVTDDTAADGTRYCYHDSGGAYAHFTGIYRELGAAPVRTVRFWVRAGSATKNTGYFVLRDSHAREVIFFYANEMGKFYINANVGGNQSFAYQADTWYRIDFTEIDWDAKTFDYSVDGTLVQAGVPFRNASQVEDVSRLDLYNYTIDAEAWWDEIWMSEGYPIDWLSCSTRRGTIPSGTTATLGLVFDAAGLGPEVYEGIVAIQTNVPGKPLVTVPARLDVDPNLSRTLVLPLQTGWNAIGWNVDTINDSVSVLLSGVMDHAAVVHGFDGGGLAYDPTIPPEFNTLTTLDPQHGLWLKMSAPDTLTITGRAFETQTPLPVDEGYNLIGYAPSQKDSISHALESVLDNTDLVLGYDGTTLLFDPQGDPAENTLHTVEPGRSYWLRMSSAGTLIYPRLPVIPAGPLFTGPEAEALENPAVQPTTEWIDIWGDGIMFAGSPLPAGALVRAVDGDGVACGEWLVTAPGKLGLMAVYRDDPFTSEDEGMTPGGTVRLYVGETLLTDQVVWEASGAVVYLNELVTGVPPVSLVNRLYQNHPNPFNPATTIRYSLASAGRVTLKIYNAAGQLVKTLVDEDQAPRGEPFSVTWDATGENGAKVASGVYFYQLKAKGYSETKKMAILK